MKNHKIYFAFMLAFVLSFGKNIAQEASSYQAYVVHEDRVYPSMTAEYEKAAKNLKAALETHQIEGADYMAVSQDNFKYLYVTPIENMAELDRNVFKPLAEKIGKEALGKIFAGFDGCYDDHGDYIVTLDKELTYMPEGIDIRTAGQDYRKFDFWYVTQENQKKLAEKAKAIKALYAEKGIKSYYRVYRSGFGTMGPYFMVVSSAKNASEWEARSAENRKLLGPEMGELLNQALKLTLRFESVSGWIRPDLSYAVSN